MRLAVLHLQLVHLGTELAVIHCKGAVVVCGPIFAVEVIRIAPHLVGRGAAAAGNDVRNPAMLVALVVVHMPGDGDDVSAQRGLPLLQHLRQRLFVRTGGVSAHLFGRLGIRRVMHGHENEVHISRDIGQLSLQPLPLCAGGRVVGI